MNGEWVQVDFDYPTLRANSITSQEIASHTITANELTVDNIEGENGWINFHDGTFSYSSNDGKNGITWDGNQLNVRGNVSFSSGESIDTAVVSVVNEYGISNSESEKPTEWSEDSSGIPAGSFLWQRTTTTYASGKTTVKEAFLGGSGAKGDKGDKGDTGQNALSVQISSSNGNIFKNDNIVTTLTCTVYYGTSDVTNQVTSFNWIKVNEDGTVDENWSRLTSVNIININNNDVDGKASFGCEIEIDI